jgi:RTX toxins and related Ca2+-binding proteins
MMKQTSRRHIPVRLLAFFLALIMLNPGIVLPARAYDPADYGANVITGPTVITDGGVYLIQNQNLTANTASGIIWVEAETPVTLIFDGTNTLTTGTAGWSPLLIGTVTNGGIGSAPAIPGKKADVTIILAADSDTSFICNSTATASNARAAGIDVALGSKLTIQSEGELTNAGKLTAIGGYYGAGIGSGANKQCGKIIIESGIIQAESNASLSKNGANSGAGIGGGGGDTYNGGSSDGIIIRGTADVTAISRGHGAGIGGGGGATSMYNGMSGPGTGGNIEISGHAVVKASSEGSGAGIGGGGATQPSAVGGAGGDIKISGHASVTATSANSAGIGGGGTINGAAGAGGDIAIFGTPIVVAKATSSSAKDIGPGISSGGVLGTAGSITITSGNVHAEKTSEVTNGLGDVLKMKEVTPALTAGDLVTYAVMGTLGNYTYRAIADENDETYVWLPAASSQYTREAQITVVGVKETAGGAILYSMPFFVNDTMTPCNIDPSSLPVLSPTWVLADKESDKLNGIDATEGDQTIELIYESGLANVTIYAKEYGTGVEFFEIIIPNQVIGASYACMSPSVPGYQLVDGTGASIAPSSQAITVTATGPNEITFYYKLASGNQLVIYEDAETGAEIGRSQIDVLLNAPTLIPVPTIANYTEASTAETVTWDGSTSLPDITYFYTRDKQPLTLLAYDALTNTQIGTIEHKIQNLRVLENYDYAAKITDLTDLVEAAHPHMYTLVHQSSTLWYVDTDPANNVVKVYYNPVQNDKVTVECRIDSQIGELFHSYTIAAVAGQAVTLTEALMPDFSALGLVKDALASKLMGTAGDPLDNIILVYRDERFETTISNDIDGIVISDKTVAGETKLLYPPYKPGYIAAAYSIDGGTTKVSIAPTFSYSATVATDIIFYYEAYPQTTGDLTIVVTTSNGAPLAGATVSVSLDGTPVTGLPLTDADGKLELPAAPFGSYSIAVSHSGYQNASVNTTLHIADASQTITIALAQVNSGGTPEASILIRCEDEHGTVLYQQSMTAVVGKRETIYAPPLKGHVLAAGEASSREVRIVSGSNVVTFRYTAEEVELDDPQVPTGDANRRPPVSDTVRELLETGEHIRYINGYPDGTVRPDSNMNRAEAAAIFWRLMRNADKHTPVPNRFTDMDGSEWYAQAVNYLADAGILTGYADGTFGPERSITRSEFAALISRFAEPGSTAANPFADVPASHWAHDYVATAYQKGWIHGYPDHSFRPESAITRGEIIKIVNYMLGRGIQAQDVPEALRSMYTDLPMSHWAFAEVLEASTAHDYERLDNGYEVYTDH